jgi:hypothetical protein
LSQSMLRLAPEAAFVRFHAVGHSHNPPGRSGEVGGDEGPAFNA